MSAPCEVLPTEVTIVIPTHNRHEHLHRLLKFLTEIKNPYPVIVLDSSCSATQQLNSDICRNYAITHRLYSENCHFGIKIKIALNENITTEYVIFCADDDFVIPDTIAKGIEFLKKHPDHSAVTGVAKCLAYPKRFSQYGIFAFLDHLKNPLILQEPSFLARYLKLIAFYTVGCPPLFYALRRTQQVKSIFNLTPESFKYSSLELINNSLTILWGKTVTLPHLLMIRNYSSEPIVDNNRQDEDYYISIADAEYIRSTLKVEMKKLDANLTEEIINYTLDQFLALPLKKNSEYYKISEIKTALAIQLEYKKNWFFYICNYLFPSFLERLDTTLKRKIIKALKKAFSAQKPTQLVLNKS